MLRIRFTNSAEADLLELWLTIAEENLVAADESLDSIQSTVSLLATQPEIGKARPEFLNGFGIGFSHWPNLRMAKDMIDGALKIAGKPISDKRCYRYSGFSIVVSIIMCRFWLP